MIIVSRKDLALDIWTNVHMYIYYFLTKNDDAQVKHRDYEGNMM